VHPLGERFKVSIDLFSKSGVTNAWLDVREAEE
jgi:hypothetical protein